jgi:hypothetical protein
VFVNGQLLAMTRMYQDIAKRLVVAFPLGISRRRRSKTRIFLGSMFPVFGLHGCQRAKGQTERVVTVVTVKQPCLEKDTL